MKSSLKISVLCFTASLSLAAAEPSAFGAGDLTSPEPYGLTSNEKVILETKQKLKKVAQKSHYQENELDSLRERIDGLQSIIESLSIKAHNNKVRLEKFSNATEKAMKTNSEYERRLAQDIQANTAKIDKLASVITKLSEVVDTINIHYVTKNELNALVQDVNEFKTLVTKELKEKSSNTKKKTTSPQLYNQAKRYYDKKYYSKAIEAYEELIQRRYKPAYAHYMIGEMYYKRKNYAKAISYFKKSAKLYSKASYMPTLMLHTALAMLKTGDEDHANAFFGAVIQKYPHSKEARVAQKYVAH